MEGSVFFAGGVLFQKISLRLADHGLHENDDLRVLPLALMGSLSWHQLCCQKSCWLFISAAASAARGGKNQILTMDNGLGLVQAGQPTQSKDFNQNLKFTYLLSFRVAITADLFNSTILPFVL